MKQQNTSSTAWWLFDDMSDQWKKLFDEARNENGLGNVEHAEALVSFAIQAAEKLPPNSPSYSSAQCSFALWRYCQDRFAEAEVFQNRYINAEREIGIGERELANLLAWMAEMQQKQGKLEAAKETIENAIKHYPSGCLPELSGAYEELASVFERLSNLTEAAAARKKSIGLRKEWDDLVESRGVR